MYMEYYIQDCHGKCSIQQEDSFYQQIGIKCEENLINCYIWRITLCGTEPWVLRNVDHKYLQRFEVWCWRRMEKISLTDRVMKVLHKVREKGNFLHTIAKTKT